MKIAVIPARGGSKRIPKKNIRLFMGRPIIEISIFAAKETEIFDKIIVSTDDVETAEIAKSAGADVPFIRPSYLSDDFTGTTEVISHATRWVIENGFAPTGVCCIYPAAPFITPLDIVQGWNDLISGDWAFTFPATEYPSTIFRSFQKNKWGGVEMFFPEKFNSRSQDLPIAMHDAGQFYWGRPESWLQDKKIFDAHSKPIIIPSWRVCDIDTMDDWSRAEIYYKCMIDNV